MPLLLELSMPLAYDPSTAALTSPGAAPTVLPSGIQPSLAALCSELSRLVYVAFEADTVQAKRLLQDLNRAGIAAYTPICSAETGTQAFGVTLADGRALLVFRGTEPQALSDLGTDLSATPMPWRMDGAQVHQGFKRAFDSIEGVMTAWLAGRHGAQVICTGHSLGAALATLAASQLQAGSLYTFGSPRVGNQAFAATLASTNVERYVDCCDVVPHLPPESPWYVHVGERRYIDAGGHMAALGCDPTADRIQARADYLLHDAWRIGALISRDLADHSPINYVRAFFG